MTHVLVFNRQLPGKHSPAKTQSRTSHAHCSQLTLAAVDIGNCRFVMSRGYVNPLQTVADLLMTNDNTTATV